jgi:hypothetical protein
METDAEASGIQSWLFVFVSVTLTTIQTHRFPTSFSRMGSLPMRRVRIGSVDTKIGHSFTEQYDHGLFPNAGTEQPKASCF